MSTLTVTDPERWVWMPHAAHFILGNWCRFHLATYIPCPVRGNGVLVSTVGELLLDEGSRELFAKSRGIVLVGRGDARLRDYMNKIGYQELGCGRKYETMVFPAQHLTDADHRCCPYRPADYEELEMVGYNDPGDAYEGHLALCRKWSTLPTIEAEGRGP